MLELLRKIPDKRWTARPVKSCTNNVRSRNVYDRDMPVRWRAFTCSCSRNGQYILTKKNGQPVGFAFPQYRGYLLPSQDKSNTQLLREYW